MSFLKLNGGICVTLVVLAMLIASPKVAQTEMVVLKCPNTADMIIVDLTNKTVNNKPANITPTAIDWDVEASTGHFYNHIDRTTGALTTWGTIYPNTPIPSYTCMCTVVPQTHF